MSESANYVVLFSGGGDAFSNHSRYYLSLKQNYELLLERGVLAENIIIAFADGVQDPEVGLSPLFDTHVQLEGFRSLTEAGINDFAQKFNVDSNSDFNGKLQNLRSTLFAPENGELVNLLENDGSSGSLVFYDFDNGSNSRFCF